MGLPVQKFMTAWWKVELITCVSDASIVEAEQLFVYDFKASLQPISQPQVDLNSSALVPTVFILIR